MNRWLDARRDEIVWRNEYFFRIREAPIGVIISSSPA